CGWGFWGEASARHWGEEARALPKIVRVEAFGEPAIYWSKKIAGLISLALTMPEPRHAHRSAQLPRSRLLHTGDGERSLKIFFSWRRTYMRQLQRDFAGYANYFCFVPAFVCCLHRGHRFANAAPGIIKLRELRIGVGQM